MDRSVMLVPLNLDLSEHCFELALSTFLQNWPLAKSGAALVRSDKIPESVGGKRMHLAVFFERCESLDMKGVSASDEKLVRLLERLDERDDRLLILDVALVDCGKESCGPLSGFPVLCQKLELISGFVPEEASAQIFSIDFSGEIEMGVPMSFFATTSEAFRRHLGRYVERTLAKLNGKFGRNILPEFPNVEDADLNRTLTGIQRAHRAFIQ